MGSWGWWCAFLCMCAHVCVEASGWQTQNSHPNLSYPSLALSAMTHHTQAKDGPASVQVLFLLPIPAPRRRAPWSHTGHEGAAFPPGHVEKDGR